MNTMLPKLLRSERVESRQGGVVEVRRRILADDRLYGQWLQLCIAPDYIPQLAAELACPESVVDEELTHFLYISSQVVCAEGLDFEYVRHGDNGEAIRQKFIAYQLTRHDELPRLTHRTINLLDANPNPVTAPGVDTQALDPKSATTAKRGKTTSEPSS